MSQTVGTGGGAVSIPRARARLLVVDDDAITLRTLERALKEECFEVDTAQSVEEAKELIAVHEYDGALIDLRLHEDAGAPLVGQLRTAERPCSAVMISGVARSVAAREALAAGAEGFLVKPVQRDELLGAMRRTVDRTRRWREQVDGRELSALAEQPRLSVVEDLEPEHDRPRVYLESPPLATLKALDIEWCADRLRELAGLTEKERTILVYLLRGEHNSEIAESYGASQRTVKYHVSNILKKLRISQRAELVRFLF